ncbi:YdgH/BhsA/McbA-like domain containing protein [Serratia aquatilis]|uniref:YdgH/BhsA/McbA-like domain containing protein n=1 Tax=Serratia aquatilis TaxID=1737515 RepID=A0ABV6EKV8_9GAMM
MKNIMLILALSCAYGSALAATPVTMAEAQRLQKIGEVSSQATTLDSFEQMIAADAERKGASAYRITSATVNNHVYGTAVLYK